MKPQRWRLPDGHVIEYREPRLLVFSGSPGELVGIFPTPQAVFDWLGLDPHTTKVEVI